MSNDSIQITYDHYKETFAIIEKTIAKRQKNFIIASLLVLSSVLLTVDSTNILKIFNDLIKEELKFKLDLTYAFLNSALLFLSVWFFVGYFQNVKHIETLYNYIHGVEKNLCSMDETLKISREGVHYLENYSKLQSIIHSFFRTINPTLIIILSLCKGYYELAHEPFNKTPILKIFDILAIILLILLNYQYLRLMNKGFSKKLRILIKRKIRKLRSFGSKGKKSMSELEN